MFRLGMLTSGGDCQALNAAMRGVVKTLCEKRDDVEIYGFQDGYKGLIYSNFKMLTAKDFSGILTMGGTILGTSRQPFKLMRVPDENGLDKVEAMKHTYHKLNLDCLVILGGNGTHKSANMLREEGLNVVTLPKTIDNDLWGTDMTFGFQSAVDIATDTIDRIHTTATSHSRVFIVEVMGHKVGWVTLHAGIAGGADIILLPEIPYDIDVIAEAINKRGKAGKTFHDHCGCRRCDFQRRCETFQEGPESKKSKRKVSVCCVRTGRESAEEDWIRKSVLQCQDIHSEEVLRAHMTVCLQQDSVRRQQRQFWTAISAICSELKITRLSVSHWQRWLVN